MSLLGRCAGSGEGPHTPRWQRPRSPPLGTALGDGSKRRVAAPRLGTGTVLWHADVFLGTLLLCSPRRERFSPKTRRLGSNQCLEWGQGDGRGKASPGAGAKEWVRDLSCWHPACRAGVGVSGCPHIKARPIPLLLVAVPRVGDRFRAGTSCPSPWQHLSIPKDGAESGSKCCCCRFVLSQGNGGRREVCATGC